MLPLELVFRGAGHEVSLDGHIFAPKPMNLLDVKKG